MSWWVRIGVAVVVLAAAAPAGGVEIVDEGLRLELGESPGCVVWPRALQDPASCQGRDVAKLADNIDAQVAKAPRGSHEVGMVIWDPLGGNPLIMNAMAVPSDVASLDYINGLVDGMYNSLHPGAHGDGSSNPWLREKVTIAGTPGLRLSGDAVIGGAKGRLVAYVLFGTHHYYAFTFMTGGEDSAVLRGFSGSRMASLTLPPLSDDERAKILDEMDREAGDSATYRLGKLVGTLVVVAGVLAFLVTKAVKKKRAA